MSDMCGAGGAHLTARAWRRVVQASAVPGYGYRYRRWVLDSLRYVDVQDLATGGDHIPELNDVYVDVALVSRAPHQVSDDPLSLAPPDTSARHSVSEFLDRRSRAVLALVGRPGSGKSTVLAHTARRSAHPALGWGPRRRRVPVLLALREHAGSIVADPAISLPAVIRAAVGGAPGREPGDWWERQLHRGRCLVLLDGLDEVARAQDQRDVTDWIERQIAAHPDNHFVVTSRSFGLLDPLTAQADVLVIRPFTAEQIQLFLDRWYLAAERHATGASGVAARRAMRMRADESAAKLSALLRENPALHDLAVNPLLLTMIATAHRYRGALPGSRADLYGEICQVLLSRRGQAKGLPELLSWPAKQTLLAALAYQMMRDHVANLPSDHALRVLKPQLERFGSSVTGEAFLDDVARNGLLVEVAPGRYAFTHLTFQEYLAARHVTASPDLVKDLADNVSDPWWHETTLLYAATADASPIVRACLDSGTIPALTLAFDCDEASAEIDPDLRKRLDRERARAYEPGCPAEHRRLIAGVQAARLVRRTLTTASGTRVCVRPVPADLYWLFLQDTGAPQPDSPCEPTAGQPAVGIWGTEAQAFVAWLNSITATATGAEVRLPRQEELREEAIAAVLNRQLPASVTSAWSQPPPGLWLRPGQPHPHALTGAAVRQAIAADAANTALLPQILTAAVLDVALDITRDLDDVRALSGALAGDVAARATSEGEVVDLMHAHAHAIVLSYAHALDLTRVNAVAYTCAADPELIRSAGLAPARALADAIAGDLASAIDLAHTRAVQLADAIDLDLNILSAFEFDLDHVVGLARAHAASLDEAYAVARDIPRTTAALDLADVFGLAGTPVLDPALPLPGVLGLPLRWVATGPLASTLLQVLAASPPANASDRPRPGDPHQAFALALCSRAGIADSTPLGADLGRPPSDALRGLAAAVPAGDWSQATGLSRLTDACAPVSSTHRLPAPPEAALRAVTLALADGTGAESTGTRSAAQETSAAAVLRTVAATVTLIENRGKGEAKAGESIILALG
jgi:NACHT domain-containing protein